MEPMDLDSPHSLRHRPTNPPSPLSPDSRGGGGDFAGDHSLSDMEVDPNSPPLSHQYQYRHHHSQPTTTRNHCVNRECVTRVASSPSMESMNKSLSDVLSLTKFANPGSSPRPRLQNPYSNKQHTVNPNDSTPPRPCQSAPPFSTPFFKQNAIEPKQNCQLSALTPTTGRSKTSLGDKIATSCLSPAPKSKSKTGYGLPDEEDGDDDILFSHHPLSCTPAKGGHSSPALRSRLSQKSGTIGRLLHQSGRTHSDNEDFSDGAMISKSDCDDDNNHNSFIRTVFKTFLCLMMLLFIAFLVAQVLFVSASCDRSRNQFFERRVLEVDLRTDLFGQHIASTLIQKHVQQYFDLHDSHENGNSSEPGTQLAEEQQQQQQQQHQHNQQQQICHPLVLSFHGWTGVGKNFGSRILSQSFSHVKTHQFVVPLLFPHADHQALYASQIQDWIVSNVTTCSVNLFIVDEMDKSWPGVQAGLLKAIQSLTSSCVTSTSPVVFVLISNTHASQINRLFVELSVSGVRRTDVKEEHFHSIFQDPYSSSTSSSSSSSSSPHSERWYSDMSASGVIDAFVPFLPLESRHVLECVRRELVNKHVSTDRRVVDRVMKELLFSSYGDLELSTTGCKRVSDKVDYVIYNQMT